MKNDVKRVTGKSTPKHPEFHNNQFYFYIAEYSELKWYSKFEKIG